jgi:mitochondrial import inner membrane translocase subunit TIM44
VIKRAASTVGHAASVTWDSAPVRASRKVVSTTASTVAKGVSSATEPIRQNELYKSVSANIGEAIDDGSASRYGGYRTREERRRLRKQWEEKQKRRRVEANPEAGESVVLHKESEWKERWDRFKEENNALQGLLGFKRTHFDESENPVVSTVRSATDWLADTWSGMFAETEVAGVVRRFKEMDPAFNIDAFNTELREWIIPEIVDAYVKGDVETLQQWFSEAVFLLPGELISAVICLASWTKALTGNGTATRWTSIGYSGS